MRNDTKGRWLSFVCTIALLSGTTLAPAQQSPADSPPATQAGPGERKPLAESLTGVARAEYEAGRILYLDGDYQTAVVKFDRAYQESKDPRLLWNMAAAEKNLRHYVRVEELVRRYITESGTQLTEAERTDAQTLLDTVSQFIGDVTIKVQPDGANVAVDGAGVGVTPFEKPIRLEIGTRAFEIKKEGYVPHRESIQVSGGSQLLEFNLEQELHQGTLRILADPGNIIHVDGKVVGTTEWQGTLASGAHNVHVTAEGFRPYRSDTVVQDNQTTTLRITLQEDAKSLGAMSPEDSGDDYMWAWIAGGAVVVSGLAIGSYYLFRPEDSGPPAPVEGTLGTIELPFGF